MFLNLKQSFGQTIGRVIYARLNTFPFGLKSDVLTFGRDKTTKNWHAFECWRPDCLVSNK